jgi:hypothetical protein
MVMALALNIMKGGHSAGGAKAINGAIATGLTAAGTNLATALDLTADTNVIGTCASGAGVQLPSCEIGDSCEVYNGGANACAVYPDSSANSINQLSAGSSFSLGTNTMCYARKITATRWVVNLSA